MFVRIAIAALLASACATAAVSRIYVKERTDLAGGASFGSAGPYERITATAVFRIDPKKKQNRAIADIDLAPVDAEGMVEFTADLLVLKPRDPLKGNGTAIIDVPNRGGIVSNGMFNRAPASLDPQSRSDLGDALLFERGFTLVSIGWQWDVPRTPGKLGLQAPKLNGNITGLVRAEFVPDKSVSGFSLADRDHIAYPVADENAPANHLFVSDGPGLPRREIPRRQWKFSGRTAIEVPAGCEPGKIYEAVYLGTGAVPVGLGFAAVRDIASFFKFGTSPFLLGDQRKFIKRTVGFGVSQTGRFLRHMVYEGFNEDEAGRPALDAVWAHVAGAGRGGFNHRFAQPSRDGQALLHYSWPVDLPPFDDVSLLAKSKASNTAPKLLLTNNSYEYWGRAASLIHTTPDGTRDIEPDANTRIYFLAGGQHGPGTLPTMRTNAQNIDNPLDYRWLLRGLLISLDGWLRDGTAPPPSAYPKLASSELVAPASVKYPPGIHCPKYLRIPTALDFTVEPPKAGAPLAVLVPQVDAVGNELGGVRLPELDVPLGAYAGWNLRSPAIGSPERMIAFKGSFFPLSASTVRARYSSQSDYLEKFRHAGEQLAAKRFVLPSDIPKMTERGGQLWDSLSKLQ